MSRKNKKASPAKVEVARKKVSVLPMVRIDRELSTLTCNPRVGFVNLPWFVAPNNIFKPLKIVDTKKVLKVCRINAVNFFAYARASAGNEGPGIYSNVVQPIPLRVVAVDLGKIYPIERLMQKLSIDSLEKILEETVYYVASAMHHFRRKGFRLVLTAKNFDLSDKKVMNFLTMFLLSTQGEFPFGHKIYLSYSALLNANSELADYRMYLNTAYFSVINDVPMNNKDALKYLLFCSKHNLPYIQDFDFVDKPNSFLNSYKKDIGRCTNTLIIMHKNFESTKEGLQSCVLDLIKLFQYTDVLIKRKST